MNKSKGRNVFIMGIVYAVTTIAILLLILLIPDREIELFIAVFGLMLFDVAFAAYGRKNKCQSCKSLFGMKPVSKLECDRQVITWTEKKNIKNLATNSYEEIVHGELISYDVCTQCRFCDEQKRSRQTVRKRS